MRSRRPGVPGAQQIPGPLVAHRRVDPVPRRGGEDEAVTGSRGRPPGLEVSLDDLHPGEGRQVQPGQPGQPRPGLHAGNQEPAAGERSGRLAGRAAYLQQPVAGNQAGQPDQISEEFRGVARPRLLVDLRCGLEGAAELIPVIGHRDDYSLFACPLPPGP